MSGFPTVGISHDAVEVPNFSAAAAAANPARSYLLLVNDSDTTIYINVGSPAEANKGIRLDANGGSFEMSARNGNLSLVAVNAIHSGPGNKTLLVTEGS